MPKPAVAPVLLITLVPPTQYGPAETLELPPVPATKQLEAMNSSAPMVGVTAPREAQSISWLTVVVVPPVIRLAMLLALALSKWSAGATNTGATFLLFAS